MTALFLLAASYLIGSIPCGLLLGKLKGVDVRTGGSGNIGATNVNRQLGKAMGLLTLLGDAIKAVLPMIIAQRTLLTTPDTSLIVMLCGAAAFLGHLYPIYLGFKGGKGVATALGMILYLQPLAALALIAIFIAVVTLTGYVSAGSLTAAAAMPILFLLFGHPAPEISVLLGMTLLVWVQHRDNIVRLKNGSEKSWKKGGTKHP